MMCPPDHAHGQTSACYNNHKCKCVDCNANNAKRKRDRSRLIAYGRYITPRVDAAPIRDHVTKLKMAGVGLPQIAKTAGISYRAVDSLMYGNKGRKQPAWITRKNAEAILTVTADDTALVDARGAARRIQALAVMGWSHAAVGRMLGCSPQNVWQIARSTRVTRNTDTAIATLFDQIWDKTPNGPAGSVTKAKAMARRNGWVGPLHWDNIDTDPDTERSSETADVVDEIAIDLAIAGQPVALSPIERRMAVRHLCELKLNDRDVAGRLHINIGTVLRIRKELGIPASVGADNQVIIRRAAA